MTTSYRFCDYLVLALWLPCYFFVTTLYRFCDHFDLCCEHFVTGLWLPCYRFVTTLLRLRYNFVTVMLLPGYGFVPTLLRLCDYLVAFLWLHCCSFVSTLLRVCDDFVAALWRIVTVFWLIRCIFQLPTLRWMTSVFCGNFDSFRQKRPVCKVNTFHVHHAKIIWILV